MSLGKLVLAGSGTTEETDDDFNLVTALYHFDGSNGAQNNTFLDSSDSGHSLTRNGNLTQGTFSPFSAEEGKWSTQFPVGVATNKLEFASSADFAFGTGAFTVEGWAYVTADTYDYSRLFAIGPYYNNANSVGITVDHTDNSSKTSFYAYNAVNGPLCLSTSATPRNEWFHWAVTRDSTGDFRLFTNGNLDSTNTSYRTTDISPGGNQPFVVGSTTDRAVSEPYEGFMSNVRVVKGSALYTSSFTPSISPLTAVTNTKLLTCCSNRYRDKSTSAHAVTVGGNPKIQPFSPFAPSAEYDASTMGGSGYFDGSGDYLRLPTSNDFDFSGSFTIEVWLYLDDVSVSRTVLGTCANIGGRGGIYFGTSGTNFIFFQYITNTTLLSAPITRYQWNHVAAVRNGSVITLYINGTSVGSSTFSNSFSGDSANGGVGGFYSNPGVYYLDGFMSDMRVVNGTAMYTSNFTPPTAPLTKVTNTKLLLNFTNAAIFDQTGKTNVQTVSTAQLDTAVKKFGTASAEFSGNTTDKLVAIFSGITIGTGDFTIEFWVYFDAISDGNVYTLLDGRTSGDTSNLMWAQEAYGTWSIQDGAGSNLNEGWDSSTFSTGTWYHIAQTRESSVSRFFVNGTKTSGNLTDTTNYDSQTYHIGGRYAVGGNSTNGYIDELRITKGKARYTSNFTVPTEEFLNR